MAQGTAIQIGELAGRTGCNVETISVITSASAYCLARPAAPGGIGFTIAATFDA
jgi:hypothetical protein